MLSRCGHCRSRRCRFRRRRCRFRSRRCRFRSSRRRFSSSRCSGRRRRGQLRRRAGRQVVAADERRLGHVVRQERGGGGGAAGTKVEAVDASAQVLAVDPRAVHGEHASAQLARLRFTSNWPDISPEGRRCAKQQNRKRSFVRRSFATDNGTRTKVICSNDSTVEWRMLTRLFYRPWV